ncbi:MAG: monovalent cation:H+ antiporter-2, family [Solirubrobacteraceae bacterium]|nr:monovalent cation:H+ antiporter-2, family [Solirubrobacteraceae bacterium]
MHDTDFIATIAIGLSAAFVGGVAAHALRLPVIVGYLLAGMAVGPFTPGLVADTDIARELAEIGVILLMFGVGIHFSVGDLLAVRRIALPGAVGQVAIATLLGVGLASWWGWTVGEGVVFGLALSVASTVVLLRGLTAAGVLDSKAGRTAVGWLVVEDLIMVVALVLLPALAGPLGGVSPAGEDGPIGAVLALTLGKVAVFVALMLVVGVRVIPRLLEWVERTGSRELFILATLAFAIGIAYGAAELFDVSFALGAFLAGMVVNESELSHRAGEEALPLREAFAVLFFVSVGMLIDPAFLVDELGRLLAVVAVVIIGKALAALVIVLALRGGAGVALTVAAGLAQIGEFSFILVEMGRSLELLPAEATGLVLAAAVVSITVNPLLLRAVAPLEARVRGRGPGRSVAEAG